MLSLLYWPAAVLLLAWAQGKLLPAIRRTPPGREAQLQALALHYILGAYYLLALVFVPTAWLVALLSRLLLFDPVLNASAGEPVFAVGNTALTDRVIRQAAKWAHMKPEHLRFLLWLACLVLAIAYLLLVVNWK
jgi:hypothetical protein